MTPQPPRKVPPGTIVIIGNKDWEKGVGDYFDKSQTEDTLDKMIGAIIDGFKQNGKNKVTVIMVVEGHNPNNPGSPKNHFQPGKIPPSKMPFVPDPDNQVIKGNQKNIDKFKQVRGMVREIHLISCATGASLGSDPDNMVQLVSDAAQCPIKCHKYVVKLTWREIDGKVDKTSYKGWVVGGDGKPTPVTPR